MTSCAPLRGLAKLCEIISEILLQHEENLQKTKLQDTQTENSQMYKMLGLMFHLSWTSATEDITKEVRKYSFTSSHIRLYFVLKPHVCPDSAVRKQSSSSFLIVHSCDHSRGGFSAGTLLHTQPPFTRESS